MAAGFVMGRLDGKAREPGCAARPVGQVPGLKLNWLGDWCVSGLPTLSEIGLPAIFLHPLCSVDVASIAADPGIRMSRDENLRWAEQQSAGRFERIDGVVVAMVPERANHADRKALVWLVLRQAIAAARLPCHAYPDGMTVKVDDNDFEPDAVVHCGEPLPGDAIAVPEPLIVAEVLSPSTRGYDLTHKLVAYFRVPSVQHHLVFWADPPQILHHRRQDDGHGIETRVLTSGEITPDPPGITDLGGSCLCGVIETPKAGFAVDNAPVRGPRRGTCNGPAPGQLPLDFPTFSTAAKSTAVRNCFNVSSGWPLPSTRTSTRSPMKLVNAPSSCM